MYVGFDVGGTNLRVGIYDQQWQLITQTKKQLRGVDQPTQVVEQMLQCLEDRTMDALGVGFAGQLDVTGRVVKNAPNYQWRDVPFAQMLEDASGVPVRLVNDLNALLWGEFVDGAATNTTDALAVYVGTGVGGAIICGGRLIEGARGVAGELGHVKVQIDGRACGCGEFGCLEAYTGGVHLERQVAQLAVGQPWQAQVIGKNGLVADLASADRLSETIEPLNALWQTASSMLATSVANACTLLNPEVLVLGGGVLSNCARYQQLFLEQLHPRILAVARDGMRVVFGQREDAGMLGAAHLAYQRA